MGGDDGCPIVEMIVPANLPLRTPKRPVLILLAKAPLAGRVKTRLQERIGAAEAAEFHAACVKDMLAMLRDLTGVADIELSTDQTTDAWEDFAVARSLQAEGNLGARILHALEAALAAGRPKAAVIGSDSPTLPAAHLLSLLALDCDVALGPTEDGGYYAIACRKTAPGMFRGVKWSGADTLDSTVRAARLCGLSVQLGPAWFDVDEPADLDRLAASSTLPCFTARWFRRYWPR